MMTERSGQLSKRRLVGRILLVLLVAWLVVDKVVSFVAPPPTVGHWRSAEGEQAYARAYADVLAGLPPADGVLDVTSAYGTVRVLRWDGRDAGPPAVLLPGRSSGAPMWAENLPDWIGTRTVYALDPIGDAGLSSQRVPLVGFEDQAEWISQTLAELGVARAHVVGHSFGAANAAVLAVRHPEQVASLTLLEPVLVAQPLPASTYLWAMLTQLPVPQELRDHALAEIGGTSVEEVRERTPMAALIDIAAAQYTASVPMPRELSDEEWRGLTMPVRVDIAGTKSLAGGEAAAARLRTLLPSATTTVWPRATHSLPMQERTTLSPQLVEFWRASG